MKKFQICTLALAAVLAMGGGAVFASEQVAGYKSVTVDGVEIESEDEELLKAIENKEVEIVIENTEDVPAQGSMTIDGVEIKSEDEELLEAIGNGEVEIVLEGIEIVPAQKAE